MDLEILSLDESLEVALVQDIIFNHLLLRHALLSPCIFDQCRDGREIPLSTERAFRFLPPSLYQQGCRQYDDHL